MILWGGLRERWVVGFTGLRRLDVAGPTPHREGEREREGEWGYPRRGMLWRRSYVPAPSLPKTVDRSLMPAENQVQGSYLQRSTT